MPFDPTRVGWLSGMPRSGTTWLSQMFASSSHVRVKFCPLFSYEFKNVLSKDSSSQEWASFFEAVFATPSPFMDQEHLRKDGLVPTYPDKWSASTLIIKSNRFHHLSPDLLAKAPQARLLYLVRHPAATICSWLSNPTEFPSDADPMEQWKSGACRKTDAGEYWGFDDWKWATSQALKLHRKYPTRVRVQEYSKLVKDPMVEAPSLFDFFGVPLGPETLDFIDKSRARHDESKRSVFKTPGPDIAWKTRLDSGIAQAIEREVRGTELERFIETA